MSMAPVGNCRRYAAMEKHGVVDDIKRSNIKHIYLFSTNNTLVRTAYSVFVGYCADKNVDRGNKEFWKIDGNEKNKIVLLQIKS